MTVELDVFSGRPNPQWTLTEQEAGRVEEMLRDLPPAEPGRAAMEPGLGYRGFLVRSGARRIHAGSGVVHFDEGGSGHSRQDAKGLETYLRQLAKERGFGELTGSP